MFPICDVLSFETTRSFLTMLIFYITKKSGQKKECFKISRTERAFDMKFKTFFLIFKGKVRVRLELKNLGQTHL